MDVFVISKYSVGIKIISKHRSFVTIRHVFILSVLYTTGSAFAPRMPYIILQITFFASLEL